MPLKALKMNNEINRTYTQIGQKYLMLCMATQFIMICAAWTNRMEFPIVEGSQNPFIMVSTLVAFLSCMGATIMIMASLDGRAITDKKDIITCLAGTFSAFASTSILFLYTMSKKTGNFDFDVAGLVTIISLISICVMGYGSQKLNPRIEAELKIIRSEQNA